jgi:hypothetical protein
MGTLTGGANLLDDPVIQRLAERLELVYSCRGAGAILYPDHDPQAATRRVRNDIKEGRLEPIDRDATAWTISGPVLWVHITKGLRR